MSGVTCNVVISRQDERSKQRRGVSLAEVLSVIVISTGLLSLVATTLHRVLDHHHAASRSEAFHRVTSRLSARFRADVHACEEITLSDHVLRLTGRAGVTEYGINDDQHVVMRKRTESGLTHRDQFALPKCCTIYMTSDTRTASLVITMADPSFCATTNEAAATARELQIAAYAHSLETNVTSARTPKPGGR